MPGVPRFLVPRRGLGQNFHHRVRFKSIVYRALPSFNRWCHGKRRKGLGCLWGENNQLVCQREQDRIFLQHFWKEKKAGFFWDIGCGDGTTGSCTLQLEHLGWRGLLWEKMPLARTTALVRRSNPVLGGNPEEFKTTGPRPDFLALRRPGEFPWIWDWLRKGVIRPRWVAVENPQPAVNWVRKLEPLGFRLRWFFHDDEYYRFKQT